MILSAVGLNDQRDHDETRFVGGSDVCALHSLDLFDRCDWLVRHECLTRYRGQDASEGKYRRWIEADRALAHHVGGQYGQG